MKRTTKYRIFLCTLLLLGLILLGDMTVRFQKEQIPDDLRVENLEELKTDFGWLVTQEITPEAENVSANAFSEQDFQIHCRLLGLIPLKSVNVRLMNAPCVYTGGMPIGIYLETKGVMVIGTGTVEGKDGLDHEPARSLVQPGDYILAVNEETVPDKRELVDRIAEAGNEDLVLTLRRKEEVIDVRLETVEAADGTRKAGIWVRDNTQGIGTLTFVTENGRFGALGHGINDVDTGMLLEAEEGTLYETALMNIKKGERGNPGELSGTITYQKDRVYGEIEKNEQAGIFGTGNEHLLAQTGAELTETAFKQDVHKGRALIRTSVGGSMEDYEAEILEVHRGDREVNKGIVLRVTDERLLSLTGGIVQGMSGSPILQDGKLVGSVTHVFVQDSTKGFGIFIENMLEEVE